MVDRHNCSVVLACTCASKANMPVLTKKTDASPSRCRMTLMGRKVNSVWSQQMVHLRYMYPISPHNSCRGNTTWKQTYCSCETTLWRVEASSTGDGKDLDEIWPIASDGRRLLWLTRVRVCSPQRVCTHIPLLTWPLCGLRFKDWAFERYSLCCGELLLAAHFHPVL